VFRKESKVWTLSFEGRTVHLGDLIGLGYIAELLRHPRTPIEAIALVTSTRENTDISVELEASRIGGMSVAFPGIPMTDVAVIKTVKAELSKRKCELLRTPDSDSAARTRLQDEISKLEAYIAQTQGRRGNTRITGGAAQRSRSRVAHAIHRAISKIAKEHLSLANHLQGSIRTGTAPVYMPAEVPDWQF
jgi:hypothetical protein